MDTTTVTGWVSDDNSIRSGLNVSMIPAEMKFKNFEVVADQLVKNVPIFGLQFIVSGAHTQLLNIKRNLYVFRNNSQLVRSKPINLCT